MAADATSGQEQGLEEKAWAEARQTREKVSHLMGQYLLKGYRMLSVNCTECENIMLRTRDGTNYCVYCQEVVKAVTTTSSGPSTKPAVATANTKPCHTHATTLSSQTSPKGTKSESANGEPQHKVPIVCTGKTGDTFKLTTSPADHDTMRVCTDTKRTGIRTNPGIVQSMGTRRTPPNGPMTDRNTSEKTDGLRRGGSADEVDLPQPITSLEEARLECRAVLVSKLRWCSGELERTQSLENSILLCRLVSSIGEALTALGGGGPLSLSAPATNQSVDI